MENNLTLHQTRVIGCLIEKAVTTPDLYPLTLNSLTAACNQKSNREPVLSLTESEVQNTLDELTEKRLVTEDSLGSRVSKYRHRFCNTEFGGLKLSEQEQGIICVLFLRGPQTPGELRSRTNRLCQFDNVQQVEQALDALALREAGPLVQKLPRQPGKRESRYQHLFSPVDEVVEVGLDVAADCSEARLQKLEQEVSELKAELATLKAQLSVD